MRRQKMVDIKDIDLCMENLKMKGKKDKMFLTFQSRNSNPRFSKIPSHDLNHWRWWNQIQAWKLTFLDFTPLINLSVKSDCPHMFRRAWIVIRKPKEMWAPSGFEFTSTFRNNHIWYPRIIPMIMQNINLTFMYFFIDLIYPWFLSQKLIFIV